MRELVNRYLEYLREALFNSYDFKLQKRLRGMAIFL